MTITPQNYAAWITTVSTRIGQLYSEMSVAETHTQWSTPETMQGSIYSAGWTGRMPKPRAWYGSRVVHEPAPQTYQVEPIPYELTYAIDRFKLDDSDVNGTSIFWRMLPDMVRQWRLQPEYELRDLLEAAGVQGTTARQAGLDGLSFWNTAHPIDIYLPGFNFGGLFTAGTYCNDFTSGGQTIGGTLIGGALSPTAVTSIVAYMKQIPGEDGETLGVVPNVVMIPNTLELEANLILRAMSWAPPSWGAFAPQTGQVGAADNMLAKMGLRPLVNPYLKGTKKFYITDTNHSVRMALWITREAPAVVPRMQENDPMVFDQHKFTWGGWDRCAAGWGFSFLAARSGP
jgi:phage major head subunit gpT-like protein